MFNEILSVLVEFRIELQTHGDKLFSRQSVLEHTALLNSQSQI